MTAELLGAQTARVEFTIVDRPRRPQKPRKSRAGIKRPSVSPWTPTTTFRCPNCDERWHPASMRPWYCSLRCRSEATLVRYARRKLREHPDGLPEDINEAIGIQMAHALSGGYDQEARRLSPEVRAAVWERDAGRCVMCDELGEEIDHIDGPSSELSNLRLLCASCHHEVTRAHMRPITDEETRRRRELMMVRIYSDEPLMPCDVDNWNAVRKEWRRAHTEFA